MSPNAMGNANASQITQLEEMKKAIDAKVEMHNKVLHELGQCLLFSQNNPFDMLSLSGYLGHLAAAQSIATEYSLSELKTQSAILEEALSRAKSPIATATIHRPSLKL